MALINDKVHENARKCHDCIVQVTTKKMQKDFKNDNLLIVEIANFFSDDPKLKAVDLKRQVDRLTCNLCPKQADFQKVYGMSPYEYFLKEDRKMASPPE